MSESFVIRPIAQTDDTTMAHVIRTVIALVAGHVGLTEEKIRVISPDIGGGCHCQGTGLRHGDHRPGGVVLEDSMPIFGVSLSKSVVPPFRARKSWP